ncbi:hypothetical protein HHI36_009401, partial [Cryptolaemus montrouzieri]
MELVGASSPTSNFCSKLPDLLGPALPARKEVPSIESENEENDDEDRHRRLYFPLLYHQKR